jgi:hypothetical protein
MKTPEIYKLNTVLDKLWQRYDYALDYKSLEKFENYIINTEKSNTIPDHLSHKLFEGLALINYHNGDDSLALKYIQFAIDSKGEVYPEAQKLIAIITESQKSEQEAQLYRGSSEIIAVLGPLLLVYWLRSALGLLNIFDLSESDKSILEGVFAYNIYTYSLVFQLILIPIIFIFIVGETKISRYIAICYFLITATLNLLAFILLVKFSSDYISEPSSEWNMQLFTIFLAFLVSGFFGLYFILSKRIKYTFIKDSTLLAFFYSKD